MSESEQSGAGRREVAYRMFAAEFDDADYSYSESDEERAPNYVITPTGARVNRLFVVGVLTEVESVSEDVLRARVVDPTGAFVLYAGQYQPDEQAFLDGVDTPTFVAVTGKARTFQPDDSDRVFTSVRPESISEVDATTRDRWTVQTAEQTLDRVSRMAAALDSDLRGDQLRASLEDSGVDEGLAAGIPLAIDHYGTTTGYLAEMRALAIDAARLVAGELDEVEGLSIAPDEGTEADPSDLMDADVDLSASTSQTASTDETRSVTETQATETDEVTSTETAEASTEEEGTTATTSSGEESRADTDSRDTVSAETTAAGSETTDEPQTIDADETTSTSTSPEPEPTGEPQSGDIETEPEADDEDIGDFDPGEFDLDEEEREEIEEEYGTEFQSGSDVPEPGEVDIETPDPEELEEAAAAETEPSGAGEPTGTGPVDEPSAGVEESEAETDAEPETEPESVEDPADETATEATEEAAEPAEDVDLEDAAVDLMGDLDDGDGASKEAVVETLVDSYGASESEAEDAIQDALMDGRCYEPDDGKLKPI